MAPVPWLPKADLSHPSADTHATAPFPRITGSRSPAPSGPSGPHTPRAKVSTAPLPRLKPASLVMTSRFHLESTLWLLPGYGHLTANSSENQPPTFLFSAGPSPKHAASSCFAAIITLTSVLPRIVYISSLEVCFSAPWSEGVPALFCKVLGGGSLWKPRIGPLSLNGCLRIKGRGHSFSLKP